MKILILSFFIYSFCGWIWESVIIPIFKRVPLFNSGFLNGPIVPIYGFGAILVILLFDQRKQYTIYEIFIYGGVAASVLEYITSYVMEKLFHRRWWDYSNIPWNLHGRICFGGFLVFGAFSLVAVRYIQPVFNSWLGNYDNIVTLIITMVLMVLFLLDVIFTTHTAYHIDEQIRILVDQMELEREKFKTYREERIKIKEVISNMEEFKKRQKRLLKAYPYLIKREYRKKKNERVRKE